MSTFVVGDVQGCYDELQLLLKKIDFSPATDKLIFAGDIINKGPDSLKTINFIMSLGDSASMVLGNHEILFLAISYNYMTSSNKNTFNKLLKVPNLKKIQEWLCNQNLLIKEGNCLITHAGIPHIWSPKKAIKRANEVEFVFKNPTIRRLLLANLFNEKISLWNKELEGIDRWLCILNYFTRMRTVSENGSLNLKYSSNLDNIPKGFQPWFEKIHKKFKPYHRLLFGHWAAIKGSTKKYNIIALDTGCVFGNQLTCYCIEKDKKYSVNAIKNHKDI